MHVEILPPMAAPLYSTEPNSDVLLLDTLSDKTTVSHVRAEAMGRVMMRMQPRIDESDVRRTMLVEAAKYAKRIPFKDERDALGWLRGELGDDVDIHRGEDIGQPGIVVGLRNGSGHIAYHDGPEIKNCPVGGAIASGGKFVLQTIDIPADSVGAMILLDGVRVAVVG